MRKTLSPEDFMREGLGVWDSDVRRLVMPNWPHCATTNEQPDVAALGIAVDVDRVWISVGASSAGAVPHLGSVWRRRLDTDLEFIVAEVARIQSETGCAVVLDRKGPAASLEDDLTEAAVDVTGASLDDYVEACNDLRDAVEAKQVEHGAYTDLDAAVAAATLRRVGDGRDVWARRNGDISMLEAVTFAMYGRGLGAPPAVYDL
jgi:hypothetical protein